MGRAIWTAICHSNASVAAELSCRRDSNLLAILYFESGNKARLEVTIYQQRQVAHAGDTPCPLPLPNIVLALFHGLSLKALNDCRLPQPKVLVNGLGPSYMSWNWMPQQMVRGQFLELIKGQEVFFPLMAQVWIRPEIPTKGFQPEHYLILNTDPPISRPFAQLKEPFVDFDVEFIGSNTKPYRFRLNAQSWGHINLVFRD